MSTEDVMKLVAMYANERVIAAVTGSPMAERAASREAVRLFVEIREALRALEAQDGTR